MVLTLRGGGDRCQSGEKPEFLLDRPLPPLPGGTWQGQQHKKQPAFPHVSRLVPLGATRGGLSTTHHSPNYHGISIMDTICTARLLMFFWRALVNDSPSSGMKRAVDCTRMGGAIGGVPGTTAGEATPVGGSGWAGAEMPGGISCPSAGTAAKGIGPIPGATACRTGRERTS